MTTAQDLEAEASGYVLWARDESDLETRFALALLASRLQERATEMRQLARESGYAND